jgi:N-formylglutamate deformylase
MLSDQEFLYQFEHHSLPGSEFNHQAHIRLAMLYLASNSLPVALQQLIQGIRSYAAALGAKEKFHFTLTVAATLLIAEAIADAKAESLLLSKVQDLPQQLASYYSFALLHSSMARQQWCAPDLMPLPLMEQLNVFNWSAS